MHGVVGRPNELTSVFHPRMGRERIRLRADLELGRDAGAAKADIESERLLETERAARKECRCRVDLTDRVGEEVVRWFRDPASAIAETLGES